MLKLLLVNVNDVESVLLRNSIIAGPTTWLCTTLTGFQIADIEYPWISFEYATVITLVSTLND